MHLLVELLPLILYCVTYVVADLYAATAMMLAALGFQLVYQWVRFRTVSRMTWVTFAIALPLGALAIASQDPRYLIARATLLYWVIGAALLVVYWLAGRNLVQLALAPHVDAPDRLWRRSLYAYAAFFGALGIGNIVLGYTVSETVWVAFDSIGVLVLIALFAILHFAHLRRAAGLQQ